MEQAQQTLTLIPLGKPNPKMADSQLEPPLVNRLLVLFKAIITKQLVHQLLAQVVQVKLQTLQQDQAQAQVLLQIKVLLHQQVQELGPRLLRILKLQLQMLLHLLVLLQQVDNQVLLQAVQDMVEVIHPVRKTQLVMEQALKPHTAQVAIHQVDQDQSPALLHKLNTHQLVEQEPVLALQHNQQLMEPL